MDQELMLDGNAAAGLLEELFGRDMTMSLSLCANCGKQGELATSHAYVEVPGVVLRCASCEAVMLCIVEAPDAYYVDARGMRNLRIPRYSA